MELKDWLGIILPLVGDGVILYLVHFYFEHYFLKTKARNDHRVEAIKEYQKLIGKVCYQLQQLAYNLPQEQIYQVVNEAVRIISIDIAAHYNSHAELLEPIKEDHESLTQQIQRLYFAKQANDLPRVKLCIQGLLDVLNKISNQCDSRIFKYL